MKFKTLLAAAAVALTSMVASVAHAAPLTVLDAGEVADGTTVNVGPLNIANHRFRIEAIADEDVDPTSGTLTVETYVDPFIALGTGALQILFTGTATSLAADWGGQAVTFTQVGTSFVADPIFTTFTQAGPAGAQLLTFSWTDAAAGSQVSVVVEAVPVPAGILLMGTAIAGFGVMRRRKKAA